MMIEQNVEALCVGMFIVDITVPKGRFRLTKVGWLEHEHVIENLKRKGIKKVVVDTSKQKSPADNKIPPSDENNQFFQQEIIKAKAVFDQSKEIQKQLFHDVQNGSPLDLNPVRKITDEAIDIIFKNPDALACVLNIRNKDEYLLEHSVSVSVLITIFSFYLEIDIETVRDLAIGAFLHDVGKTKIPSEILDKPGKLTKGEFEIMKGHATHSVNIIKNTPNVSKLSLEVVALHHEKLNGEGYPNGLKAVDISVHCRIMAICDIFDALTSTRCYKKGYSQIKAFRILRVLAKSNQLDAQFVDKFIKCMGVYPIGSIVQLESNRLAIVESHDPDDPIHPKVKPFYSLQLKNLKSSDIIDLSAMPDEKIVKCVRVDDFNLDMAVVMEFLARQG